MNIVVDGSGKVVMWSENGAPTPPAGCTLVALTDDQAAAFAGLPPNAGVTFNGQSFAAAPVVTPPPPTVAEALAAMGITIAQLQQALGVQPAATS
jgi:hypothetical protein